MTISGDSRSLLDSVIIAQQTHSEIAVSMLKKAQDQMTQQGQALIQMLDQVPSPSAVPLLDTYA